MEYAQQLVLRDSYFSKMALKLNEVLYSICEDHEVKLGLDYGAPCLDGLSENQLLNLMAAALACDGEWGQHLFDCETNLLRSLSRLVNAYDVDLNDIALELQQTLRETLVKSYPIDSVLEKAWQDYLAKEHATRPNDYRDMFLQDFTERSRDAAIR
jgi:hypothetical protein